MTSRIRKLVAAALAAGFLAPATIAADGILLDFGPPESEVADGWTALSENDLYTPQSKRGWILPPKGKTQLKLFSRNENFATQTSFLKLGPLLQDHVIAGRNYFSYPSENYTFRADVEPGDYVGAFITGVMTEKTATTINRPPFWWRDYTIRANDKTIAEVEHGTPRQLLAEFWHESERDFLPGSSLFDAYIAPRFPVHTFEFSGDSLTLSMHTFCPINALILFHKQQEAAFRSTLARALAAEREQLDKQYIEVKGHTTDRVTAEPDGEDAVILFTRDQREIGPDARPAPEERFRPAGDFTTAGETSMLRVGFLPRRDLSDVQVDVGLFRASGGAALPPESVSVWLSRIVPVATVKTGNFFRIRPAYAFRYTPRHFKAEVTRLLSVYVKVPSTADPGDYESALTVTGPGIDHPVSLRLVVRVLPFSLPQPDMLFGMYWGNPFSTRLRHLWQQLKPPLPVMRDLCAEIDRKAMTEMREAGFNTAAFGPASPFTVEEDGNIAVNETNWTLWCDRMNTYSEVFGNTPLPAYGIGWAGGLVNPRSARGFWGRQIAEWEKQGFADEAVHAMEKLCRRFYEEARRKQWPEIIFYVQDEMANHGMRGGRMATERARLFRQVADAVGFRTCASMNGPVEIPSLPYLDIAIPNGALPITEENLQRIRDDGCDLWFYNIGSTRFTFGYYLNRTRPKGRLQWSFGNTSRYLDQVPGIPSLAHINYTLHWDADFQPARRYNVEEMRQGILDYRYLCLLQTLAAKHARNQAPPMQNAVARARTLADMIIQGVKIRNEHSGEDFVAGVWSPRTCQRLRWRIVMAILAILEAEEALTR